MPFARALALVLLTSVGCATAPEPKLPRPEATRAVAPDGTPIQLATAPMNDPVAPARIGKEALEQARELLSEARNELKPGQWQLLENKLADAERAYERFAKASQATGRAAEVERGVDARQSGRTGEAAEGSQILTHAGPLLALLILLWPAETAGPQDDHGPLRVSPEEEEFKNKLRELSLAAQQVKSELAARRAPPVEAAQRDRPPKPNSVSIQNKNAPRDAECEVFGSGGNGPFQSGNSGWLRCEYVCGRYRVTLYDIWGNSTADCKSWAYLKRARKEADNWAKYNDKEE